MRLNGWQRLGIVASVIWAIAGPFYIVDRAEKSALEHFSSTYSICIDAHPTDADPKRCTDEAKAAYEAWFDPMAKAGYGYWAARAFVPLVVAWLLAYALVYLVRWIALGFRKP